MDLSFSEDSYNEFINVNPQRQNVQVGNFVAPVQTFTLRDRLRVELGMDDRVISLILDSKYTDPNGREIPLFAIYPFDFDGQNFVMDNYEIIQAINDYDDFMQFAENPEEGFLKFSEYIGNLVLNKSYKIRENLLISSDSVFQSPSLEGPRKEEMLKLALANRRRMATTGTCMRKGCTSKSIYKESRILRSGDEAAVWIMICAVCDYQW